MRSDIGNLLWLCPLLACLVLLAPGVAAGVERFPPPQFVEPHPLPATAQPPARADWLEWMDVAVLAGLLAAATYLALRRRSRRGLLATSLASLAYLGFYRQGCVCPIGAIQNVTLALFDSTYVMPLTVLAFFLLPLAATLFVGRTFCAAVCPLGAVQDVVLIRPVQVPAWLEGALGLLPYAYLGVAVLFAAMGSAFVVCQYDPFVGLFRLSGSVNMLVFGASLLVAGLFIGRPYCRYLCPYGAVLRHASRLSRWHVTITPDECIKCRLCQDACPFGAIQPPMPAGLPRRAGKAGLVAALVAAPALVVAGGWLGGLVAGPLARSHPTVRLAERISQEEAGLVAGTINISDAFRQTRGDIGELYAQAKRLYVGFGIGSMLLGGFLGLVVGGKLVALSIRRRRTDYTPNRATCLSCGRCFEYCPRELVRLKKAPATPGGPAGGSAQAGTTDGKAGA